MWTRARPAVDLVAVAILLAMPGGRAAVAARQDAAPSGDVIRSWNRIAVAQPFGNSVRLSRVLGIMHAAQHDAVNSVDPRFETYAARVYDPTADPEAAAASAAHSVLVWLFPDRAPELELELERSLAGVTESPAREAGVRLGHAAARAVIERRADDGFDVPDAFAPAAAPGVWQPTPPAFSPMVEPQFGNVRPFAFDDRQAFLPTAPPALASAEYARDLDEVRRVGQDTNPWRTADQTHVAHFWVEPSPVGWSRLGARVSEQHGYDLHQTARLMALLNMAMADGFIVGWHQKIHYGFWRPVTAVQLEEPTWTPLRPTPAAPDYPSTHSVLGGAAAEVLRRFTGNDALSLCMVSSTSTPEGSSRCWQSFTEAELENAESRVLVGFHFRFAIETGLEVGRQVGAFAFEHALRPL